MAKGNKLISASTPTLVNEGERIDRIFKQAVRNALREHKRAGNPVAVWRDGRVVLLQPDQIQAS